MHAHLATTPSPSGASHHEAGSPTSSHTLPKDTIEEARYQNEYKLQMQRLSCPSCGEEPVA
jgi:hypothetical protein